MSTLGLATIGSDLANSAGDFIYANGPYTMSENGTVDDIKLYVSQLFESTKFLVGIYADTAGAPGALIATATERTIAAGDPAWMTFTFSSPPTLDSGSVYWISFITDHAFKFAQNLTNSYKYDSHTYDSAFTNPFTVDGSTAARISIYVDYSAVVVDPPGAPSNLSHASLTNTTVTMNWLAGTGVTTGFTLERSTHADFSSPTNVDIPSGATLTKSVTGLSAKTLYYYRILGYNTGGNSSWSNTDSFTTQGVPDAPTNLAAGSITSSSAALSWDAGVADPTQDGFTLQYATQSDFSDEVEIDIPDGDTQTATVLSLAPLTRYYVRVSAYNSYGDGAWSDTVFFDTMAVGGGSAFLNSAFGFGFGF